MVKLFSIAVIVTLLTACAAPPHPPNAWDRTGNSLKHGATALRVGYQSIVKSFVLLEFRPGPPVAIDLFRWDNWQPTTTIPSPLIQPTPVK